MIERIDSTWTRGTYIIIRNLGTYWNGKEHSTNRYDVLEQNNSPLGKIEWNTAWRKYWFLPAANTGYEEVCMEEISQFIKEETAARKEARKNASV